MGSSQGIADFSSFIRNAIKTYSGRNKSSDTQEGSKSRNDRSEDEASVVRRDRRREIKEDYRSYRRHGGKDNQVSGGADPVESVVTPVTTTPTSSTPTTPSVPTETPATQPTSNTPSVDNDLLSLAGKYVENYTKQSGKTLSSDQKTALIQDVYSFYSTPSRAGRLAAVVNA